MTEQNKLQDGGKENSANEYDDTAATEKTLDNDEANLRGEEFSIIITDGLRSFDSSNGEFKIQGVLVVRPSAQYLCFGREKMEVRIWSA